MHVPLEVFRFAMVILASAGAHKGEVVHKSILSIHSEDWRTAQETCKDLGEDAARYYVGRTYPQLDVVCRAPLGLPA